MSTSTHEGNQSSTVLGGQHHHYHQNGHAWIVRVRNTKTYLWGSAGITKDAKFATPLILHFRNTTGSDSITFGTITAEGVQSPTSALNPGEAFSISLNAISGVFAITGTLEAPGPFEAHVHCFLK